MIHISQVLKNEGFAYKGVWITDIFLDETGRNSVDPRRYYNISFDMSKKKRKEILLNNLMLELRKASKRKESYWGSEEQTSKENYFYLEALDLNIVEQEWFDLRLKDTFEEWADDLINTILMFES